MSKSKTSNLRGVFKKRVEIARDVLLQLKVRHIVAKKGRVLSSEISDALKRINQPDSSAQEFLKSQSSCGVCAQGACLVAYIERHNQITVDQLLSADVVGGVSAPGFDDVFSKPLLSEMEALFERSQYIWNEQVLGDYLVGDIVSFSRCKLDDDPDKRLAQIMRRLIKNNGRFCYSPKVAKIERELANELALAAYL